MMAIPDAGGYPVRGAATEQLAGQDTAHIIPQSTQGKAISYLSNNWLRLTRYLEGGHRCHRGAERIASRI